MKLHMLAAPRAIALSMCVMAVASCSKDPWNNPNPANPEGMITYQSVMSPAPPKHLDPVISYATDETLFISQIYQPPLGYHFLKRPYQLQPLGIGRPLPKIALPPSESSARFRSTPTPTA